MGRKLKFIANCTDVIVTNCKKEGRLCSTPFYMVVETNGEIEEITSITINLQPLPPNLIRWIAVRRKRFQLFFSAHQATAEEIQKEREKEVFIEQEATRDADEELALEPTGAEVLETIGITGRAYHILPLEAEGTITPTAHQLELFNLHDGDNIMRIKLKLHRKNKKREYTCLIHIWKFDPSTQFVISDIDGTITKYEFWNFVKISTELNPEIISKFQELKQEGLVFLYVTIRAFAATEDTRKFLRSINVPEGPVLTCPTDFRGIMRAYVAQRVCQLKLVHLYYLKSMFPDTAFYGAYGNTKADAQVYKSSAVNSDMIVNVAPKERPSMTETAKGFVVNVLDRFSQK